VTAATAVLCGCIGASTGGLQVAVRFPALRTAALPAATETVPVVVDKDGAVVAAAILTRDRARLLIPNLPAGDLTVYAAAVGSDQQVLALGKTSTTLLAGRLAQAQVEMLPLLVFGGEERLSIMASLRRGFSLDYGLSLKPLPPGDEIKPGSKPSAKPSGNPIQLGTLTAQPVEVAVGYPVALSIVAERIEGDLSNWDVQWQGGSTDTSATTGRISATTIKGNRAEAVWTPDAPGTFVFRVTLTDGTASATSNDVSVTVTRSTGGAIVGGNF
jgi:hypothetical protein